MCQMSENDVKGTYGLMKEQAGWKSKGPPRQFHLDGKSISSPKQMADIQMNVFRDKVHNLKESLPNNNTDPLQQL